MTAWTTVDDPNQCIQETPPICGGHSMTSVIE
jgi:hypothetical protein